MRSLFPPAPPRPDSAGPKAELELTEPRARLVRLLQRLQRDSASDLHLRSGASPLVRKDGTLEALEEAPTSAEEIELTLRSIMSGADFAVWKQDGDADFAYELPELARFRANAGRDRLGPFAVFRLIPAAIRSVTDLGLSAEVQALCSLTRGLVLVTGPTGSGKSTTLAALVDLVNRTRNDHIITIATRQMGTMVARV